MIGLTTDPFASRKTHPIRPFEDAGRISNISSQEKNSRHRGTIEPLTDQYGSALDADFDAIIVSEETLPVAVEINKLRQREEKRKVDIHQISCVLAEDGRWISSTRIYRGEIDVHGHLMK